MLIASLIIIQVFVFSVLIYVFRKIMTKNITSATDHLDQLNHDYENKEIESAKKLEDAEKKSGEILAQARGEAEKIRLDARKEITSERDKIINQAHIQSDDLIQQADKSRKSLIAEIEQKIAGEAIKKACELTRDSLPLDFKKLAQSYWIDDLIKNGFDELKDLAVGDGIREAKVISAFPLSQEVRKSLVKRLKLLLKRDISLKEEIDSSVIVGIIVTIGNLVLDGSLSNKIRQQAKDIQAKARINE
ncbi:MAG TPA: hypothetical protein ENH41_01285 [Candidatus Omnitrophica bacterium]|nr:hypothetical protein [Candidatus Omnitrophota bacterium]